MGGVNTSIVAANINATFSTQDEADIGKKLLISLGEGDDYVQELFLENLLHDDPTPFIIDLTPDPNFCGTDEDYFLNEPLNRHIKTCTSLRSSLLFTGKHCALIDMKNREQRADQVLLSCHVLEWPNVITMLDGKLDLRKDFCKLLGQARRRASAILDAQTWRDFIIIIIYDTVNNQYVCNTQLPLI